MKDIILWDPVFWVGGTNRANATAHTSKLLNIYVFGFNNNNIRARIDSILLLKPDLALRTDCIIKCYFSK
jgi:hypothetical protein